MSVNSIPIRFEELEAIQLQLLFEEHMFVGFEKIAIKYCRWLLSLDEEQRKRHHRSLSRIAHAVRTAHGRAVDITPECSCQMCAQWHSAAVRELCCQADEERARRKAEKSVPKPPEPTFIYLVLDERTGFIKVGRSKNPSARERTLQSENPQLKMLFSGPADADLEQELHREFSAYRGRGEWFRLSERQTENIKKRILDSCADKSNVASTG
ncbi:MAG TPA: GIY-YIG nuclease family protein [Terracidiphilus sp.]|nr:GIY-YIG nuclease family protein [Terracidiphilus sp.]